MLEQKLKYVDAYYILKQMNNKAFYSKQENDFMASCVIAFVTCCIKLVCNNSAWMNFMQGRKASPCVLINCVRLLMARDLCQWIIYIHRCDSPHEHPDKFTGVVSQERTPVCYFQPQNQYTYSAPLCALDKNLLQTLINNFNSITFIS